MDTLILTGWGWMDYAGAAAVALRHWCNADVLGMSKRRLPEYLNELANNNCEYKRIIILGVSLEGYLDLLLSSLTVLKQKSIDVHWISTITIPEYYPEDINNKLKVQTKDTDTLTEAVAEIYGIECTDILNVIKESPKKLTEEIKRWHILLEGAMYVYRNYQDGKSYSMAIKHLAQRENNCTKWSKNENRVIDHYQRYGSRELVGKSDLIRDLQEKINLVAPRDRARVIIYGETGTGKETVAIQIHNKSPRRNEPFISFNCASVATQLLESRFFGYEKGSFTGANARKVGLFESADGGSLFLDEIGELDLEVQGLLLRVLEGGRFTRIGGTEEVEVDVRLITATHRDLAGMVREGNFREDLFHRLNIIPIKTPSLREHIEDIPLIANSYWMRQYRRRLGKTQLTPLQSYDWPGNVRELFNILERASVLDEMDFAKLLKEHIALVARTRSEPSQEYPENLEDLKRLHISNVLAKHDNNISHAASALGITRNTLKKYLESNSNE
jgi:transcriptional regulator with PAS, ATPase and Fis domain